MLSGFWLLCDLDGTLISTPHKANGAYLTLHQSKCLIPVQRWLLNGGNICVVTTADQRVLRQMYEPLRECLGLAEQRVTRYQRAHYNNGEAEGRRAPIGGKLLLSLYTGAVLYTCSAKSMDMVSDYLESMHCATVESVELSRQHNFPLLQAPVHSYFFGSPEAEAAVMQASMTSAAVSTMRSCVRGTCVELSVAIKLHALINTIYHRFLRHIIQGHERVIASLKKMSRRYKNMWKMLLSYLDLVYFCCAENTKESALKREAVEADFLKMLGKRVKRREEEEESDERVLFNRPKETEAVVDWKVNYFAAHGKLLLLFGILRIEFVEQTVSLHNEKEKEEKMAATKLTERELLREVRASSEANEKSLLDFTKKFSVYITSLLGPDLDSIKTSFESSPTDHVDIAQIIVLGIPLTLFSFLFKKHLADLIKAGVNAIPQPNSVVFSKLGISKSTALRYLLGKDRVVAPGKPKGQIPSLCGCVEVGHAAAFGDNPHSTDYELTVFEDIPFVSVEKDSQRSERHHRIASRLAEAEELEQRGIQKLDAYGQPFPSVNEVIARLHRSGSLMDDRMVPHIMHIGGEEEGTALYLNALMNLLRVPAMKGLGLSGSRHDRNPPVSSEEFQQAMITAATVSRDAILRGPLSKL